MQCSLKTEIKWRKQQKTSTDFVEVLQTKLLCTIRSFICHCISEFAEYFREVEKQIASMQFIITIYRMVNIRNYIKYASLDTRLMESKVIIMVIIMKATPVISTVLTTPVTTYMVSVPFTQICLSLSIVLTYIHTPRNIIEFRIES